MNPSRPRQRPLHAALVSISVLLAAGLTACTTPQPVASTVVQGFDQAATQAADGLAAQLHATPAFLDALKPRRVVMVDPMIESGSGERTLATQRLQDRVVQRLTATHGSVVELVPFDSASVARAAYVLTGTSTRQVGVPNGVLTINLALTELASGKVVAQSSARAQSRGVDSTPLPLSQDSPVLAQDKVLEGYARTSTTPPAQPADADYLSRIAVAPLIEQASAHYNASRYPQALAGFEAAGAAPGGDQLRVLSGRYLALARLGRGEEAEQAFRAIVVYGVQNRQLSVKFLFTPNTTEFWRDPVVSGPYTMWLSEIAQVGSQAKVCMNIVGHTSRTGTQAYNDELSLQRAAVIRDKLAAQSAAWGQRNTTSGRGFRDNLIGTGTDDAVDALDRRVEFKIVDCG